MPPPMVWHTVYGRNPLSSPPTGDSSTYKLARMPNYLNQATYQRTSASIRPTTRLVPTSYTVRRSITLLTNASLCQDASIGVTTDELTHPEIFLKHGTGPDLVR